jgi:hypothetical protein
VAVGAPVRPAQSVQDPAVVTALASVAPEAEKAPQPCAAQRAVAEVEVEERVLATAQARRLKAAHRRMRHQNLRRGLAQRNRRRAGRGATGGP